MEERIINIEDITIPAEYIIYGGLEFPKYLITRETFEKKIHIVQEMMGKIRVELADGTQSGDAGDSHGQYHNEIAWYKEQDLLRRSDLAKSIGTGLDRATIINNYDEIREIADNTDARTNGKITLSSIVTIQYNNDPNDCEQIVLVAPLDGGAKSGFVSVETPLAKAIEGKRSGDVVEFKVEGRPVSIKII